MTLQRAVSCGAAILVSGLLLNGCQSFRNFTTYYNLFYNMERIMDEVEENQLYIREQKSPEPTYYVPNDDALTKGGLVFNHLERLSMTSEEAKANKQKLDSILIKGSKLLVHDPKSDYIDAAIYYMGKTYFYERDWYQSQKQMQEVINAFPNSKWQPDAHLVTAMDMLQQGDIDGGMTMLSRTIDIAWAHKRLDILINAFRLNADVEISRGNVAEALKPFDRAIALSTDNEDKARWQYEKGVVYYRNGNFNDALHEFDKVATYSPDVFTQFQTGLQRAVTLRVLGQNELADEQLNKLRHNSNYSQWNGLVELEQLNVAAARAGGTSVADTSLARIDSVYPGKNYTAYGIYERAVNAFRAGDYQTAVGSFQKVESAPVPFQRKAQRYAMLLTQYFDQQKKVVALNQYPMSTFPDSVKEKISDAYYTIARTFVALDRRDSVKKYYALSDKSAPFGSTQAARAIYARASLVREEGRPEAADSMLDVLVQNYGLTDYGADARVRLGYTEFAKLDTASDLYASGISFMRTHDNPHALAQLQKEIHNYPTSPYTPQAMYAVGLIFEKALDNHDSAFYYYSQLVNLFPSSPQAASVRPLVTAVINAKMMTPSQPLPVERQDSIRKLGTEGIMRNGVPTKSENGKDFNPFFDSSTAPPPDTKIDHPAPTSGAPASDSASKSAKPKTNEPVGTGGAVKPKPKPSSSTTNDTTGSKSTNGGKSGVSGSGGSSGTGVPPVPPAPKDTLTPPKKRK